jgi:hypothetical protein
MFVCGCVLVCWYWPQERIKLLQTQRSTKKPRIDDKATRTAPASKSAKKHITEVVEADVDEESVDSLKNDLANASHFIDDDDLSALSLGSAEHLSQRQSSTNADLEYTSLLKFDKHKFLQPKESASKKDGGKVKRLQRLLQEAERKRERLKALTGSKDVILQKKARGEQWNDALESAAGGKPLIVSTTGSISRTELKLKKALKKRDKKKQKSADEWANRLAKVEDDKQVKLQRREENLSKKKNRADETVKDTIVRDSESGSAPKKAVAIRKPGEGSGKDNHHKDNHNKNGGHDNKKKNRAGFEGKKSAGSFLNQK